MLGNIADSDATRSTRLEEIGGGQDIRNAVTLHRDLLRFSSESTPILLECSEIECIDASTIQLFLAIKTEMGDLVRLVADSSSEIRSWLRIAGAESILEAAE
ncbi:MAG: hypothetical protein MUC43_10335 [Pirellula sp.]|jgi:anti-anti-sigma regulatory factor|nr:hypothetical protein [Pirellula sp.]